MLVKENHLENLWNSSFISTKIPLLTSRDQKKSNLFSIQIFKKALELLSKDSTRFGCNFQKKRIGKLGFQELHLDQRDSPGSGGEKKSRTSSIPTRSLSVSTNYEINPSKAWDTSLEWSLRCSHDQVREKIKVSLESFPPSFPSLRSFKDFSLLSLLFFFSFLTIVGLVL